MAISARRLQALKQEFNKLDKNGDHKLSFDEFKLHEERRHVAMCEASMKALFDQSDTSGDGYLNFHEFKRLVTQHELSAMRADVKPVALAEEEGPSTCSDSLDEFMKIREGETFNLWMQRIEDEHPETNMRKCCMLESFRTQNMEEDPARHNDSGRSHEPRKRPRSQPGADGQEKQRGPERFFYDKRTYTGTSTVHNRKAGRVSLPDAHRIAKSKQLTHEAYLDLVLGNVGQMYTNTRSGKKHWPPLALL